MTKYNALYGIALLGTIVLSTTGTVALADTTTLLCNLDSANPWKEDEPSILELNEAQGYVVAHFSARTLSVNGAHVPGDASGQLPAHFNADAISFSDPDTQSPFPDFTINRLTGNLIGTNATGSWKWTCQAGKTKF